MLGREGQLEPLPLDLLRTGCFSGVLFLMNCRDGCQPSWAHSRLLGPFRNETPLHYHKLATVVLVTSAVWVRSAQSLDHGASPADALDVTSQLTLVPRVTPLELGWALQQCEVATCTTGHLQIHSQWHLGNHGSLGPPLSE